MEKILMCKKDFAGSKVLAVGYCDAQRLLSYRRPLAYTRGVYGWNADIYLVDGIYICTGYRPFGVATDYDALARMEKEAAEACITLPHEDCSKKTEELLQSFIQAEKNRLGW